MSSLGNLGGRLQIGLGKEVAQLIIFFKFSRLLVNLVNSLQAKALTAIAIFVDLIDKFVIARFNYNGQRFGSWLACRKCWYKTVRMDCSSRNRN